MSGGGSAGVQRAGTAAIVREAFAKMQEAQRAEKKPGSTTVKVRMSHCPLQPYSCRSLTERLHPKHIPNSFVPQGRFLYRLEEVAGKLIVASGAVITGSYKVAGSNGHSKSANAHVKGAKASDAQNIAGKAKLAKETAN